MALTEIPIELSSTPSIVDGGNATAITIDASENVGIGTSAITSNTILHMKDADTQIELESTNGSNSAFIDFDGTNLQLSANRNMVDGAFSNTGKSAAGIFLNGPSGGSTITFATASANNTTPTTRMTIDSAGNLLVGTTSGSNHVIQKAAASAIALNINNSSATSPRGASFTFSAATPNDGTATFFTTADSTAYRGGWLSNGGIQNYQANDSNLSDRREKTNFAPAKNYLETICAIPVQTFNYIDQNMDDDDSPSLGVVAQDVQAVAPELVVESNWGSKDDPKMRLAIYQTDFQYALMKSIQELKEELNTATARITELENN